jgi:hypothetical protein
MNEQEIRGTNIVSMPPMQAAAADAPFSPPPGHETVTQPVTEAIPEALPVNDALDPTIEEVEAGETAQELAEREADLAPVEWAIGVSLKDGRKWTYLHNRVNSAFCRTAQLVIGRTQRSVVMAYHQETDDLPEIIDVVRLACLQSGAAAPGDLEHLTWDSIKTYGMERVATDPLT